MNISNKTVLITGGGSGIGLSFAKVLSEKGNNVIITGRDQKKLEAASAGLANASFFAADIADNENVISLVNYIKNDHGKLDVVINNAGQMSVYDLASESRIHEKAVSEMQVNYFSVINLIEHLLPLLKSREVAAIVNVSSILALSPVSGVPTYSSSKAALHSFTQSLRLALAKSTAIKVFEVMPPLVNTDLSKDFGGENGIHPTEVANDLIKGMEQDIYEIHVGQTIDFHKGYFASADAAFDMLNKQ